MINNHWLISGLIRLSWALSVLLFPAVVSAGDKIPVRIAIHVSELSPLYQQAQLWADAVEKQLPGQFDFKLYPSGQLGNEKALITSVKSGAIEVIMIASGMIKQLKALDIFDLPWLFSDHAHMRRVMQGPLGHEVMMMIDQQGGGLKILGIYENGFRHIINSKHPIDRLAAMSGLKIRVSGGKTRHRMFTLLGAQPQSIDWKESFTSMETGVVDGSESAIYGFYEQKAYEIQPYLSLTYHVYTPSFLLASRAFFQRLTPQQQAAWLQAGHAITDAAYEAAAQQEARYLQAMQAKVQVNNISDFQPFRQAVKSLYEAYEQQHGRQWLDLVEAQRP